MNKYRAVFLNCGKIERVIIEAVDWYTAWTQVSCHHCGVYNMLKLEIVIGGSDEINE